MSSKSELTKTIETQDLRIKRLEQRLADLVNAYKNLQKEKEALESTLRVLSTSSSNEQNNTTEKETSSSIQENVESSDEVQISTTSSEQQSLQDKLQTLQQTLTVITEQKNRMEQMFQSDKRSMKIEKDELTKLLDEAKAENIINKEKFENEIKEAKKLLRQSQLDHDRAIGDHNVMIRELQTLLSTERNRCETIEHQFDEYQVKIGTLESQIEVLKKQNNQLNTQYQTKLNQSKEKDLASSQELKNAQEKINELTKAIRNIEMKYSEELRSELKRNQQLEKQINEYANENSQRLSTNETLVAQFSEEIGLIEKQRSQDQITIQRLKERIAQLDVENSLLTKVTSASIENNDIDITNDEAYQHYDLDTLLKHIAKLKVLIRVANDRFGKTLTIEDILNIDRESLSGTGNMNGTNNLSSDNNKIIHMKCQEEIDRLKNELEKYRNKTLAAFKSKSFKETTVTKEVEELRLQNDQLREKLANSQGLYNSEHERHCQVVEKLETCLTHIREQHRHDIEQILMKKRTEINELECELEKQRERTNRLLNEKEREIETLRKEKESSPDTNVKPIDESMSLTLPTFTNTDNNNLLYFIQEQQLREQEILSLRKHRHELELTIRDLNRKHSFEINQLETTIEQLKDDLENIKLTKQRNDILTKNDFNIDYIKNVFYHYLLSNDAQVKHTMANALMTVLHFSSKERAKVESLKSANSLTSGGWFNSK